MFYDFNIPWPVVFDAPSKATNQKKGKGRQQDGVQAEQRGISELLTVHQMERLRALTYDCAEVGYHTLAYNFVVRSRFEAQLHRNPLAPSTSTASSSTVPFPDLQPHTTKTNSHGPRIEQLTRMTLLLDEESMGKMGHGLTNSSQTALLTYDLLACQPFNDASFSTLCLSLTELKAYSVDIISLDFTHSARPPFFMKRSLVNAAIQNGAVFEVCYAPAICGRGGNGAHLAASQGGNGNGATAAMEETKARRNIISATRDLIRMTNGRGLILSSGAADLLGLRGPYDVINFAAVLGIHPTAAKDALSSTCRSLLLRAQTRKTFRGVVGEVQVVDDSPVKPALPPTTIAPPTAQAKRKEREGEGTALGKPNKAHKTGKVGR